MKSNAEFMRQVLHKCGLNKSRTPFEADHPPPSSDVAKNAWNYTSTPQISRHGVVLN